VATFWHSELESFSLYYITDLSEYLGTCHFSPIVTSREPGGKGIDLIAKDMLGSTAIAFALIIFESVYYFCIFVFWTQKLHHKRTCFLLINRAVAHLLVGITVPIVLSDRDDS